MKQFTPIEPAGGRDKEASHSETSQSESTAAQAPYSIIPDGPVADRAMSAVRPQQQQGQPQQPVRQPQKQADENDDRQRQQQQQPTDQPRQPQHEKKPDSQQQPRQQRVPGADASKGNQNRS